MLDDDDLPIIDSSQVFNIDYFDLGQVKALARGLGKGQSVVKYPDRPNYNIMPTDLEHRLPKGTSILYRT